MNRNHIHLAQGVPGDAVISGMRNSSQILIYIDLSAALAAGLKFFLSANGVVLCEGPIGPQFFARVENKDRVPLKGWEGAEGPGREARAVLSEGMDASPAPATEGQDKAGTNAASAAESAPGRSKDTAGDVLAGRLEHVELK